jgi:hypothetical protein
MTQRLRMILPRSGVLVAVAAFYLGIELRSADLPVPLTLRPTNR